MVKNPKLSYCVEEWYCIAHRKHIPNRADVEYVKITAKIPEGNTFIYRYESENESTGLVSKDQIFKTRAEALAYFKEQKTKKTNDLKSKINSMSDIINYAIYSAESSKDFSKHEIEAIFLDRAKELGLIKE